MTSQAPPAPPARPRTRLPDDNRSQTRYDFGTWPAPASLIHVRPKLVTEYTRAHAYLEAFWRINQRVPGWQSTDQTLTARCAVILARYNADIATEYPRRTALKNPHALLSQISRARHSLREIIKAEHEQQRVFGEAAEARAAAARVRAAADGARAQGFAAFDWVTGSAVNGRGSEDEDEFMDEHDSMDEGDGWSNGDSEVDSEDDSSVGGLEDGSDDETIVEDQEMIEPECVEGGEGNNEVADENLMTFWLDSEE